MDIVDFWSKQVALWQTENKCGLCWEFGAPLVNSAINKQKLNDSCCVQVMLTNIRFRKTENRNATSQLVTEKICTWTVTVHAVIQSEIDTNNYNEIKEHPVSESKWNTIYNPLLDCLSCDSILDYCRVLGYDVIVNQVSDFELVHNYLDNNYSGWRVNYTFTLRR